MFNSTFSAGICPPSSKETIRNKPIRKARVPGRLVFLLSQNGGMPAVPLVKRNEKILLGQKIAEAAPAAAGRSAPVHSSVSGKVVEIGVFHHPLLKMPSPAVTVDSDGRDNRFIPCRVFEDYYRHTPDELKKVIGDAGIVGLGGSGYPAVSKIFSGAEIVVLIANGCESEPPVCADESLMTEKPSEIIEGMKIVMYILDLFKGIIAIEENKKQAIEEIKKVIFRQPNITLKLLKAKYPQSAEKQLVKSVIGREIPAGRCAVQEGILMLNVATCFAIYEAVVKGIPLYRRVVTVAGDLVRDPGNYEVRIGTPAKHLLENCGYAGPAGNSGHKIIFGGLMRGRSQFTPDVPTIKTTRAVLAVKSAGIAGGGPCIRCSKCVDACPSKLLPNMISIYAEAGLWKNAMYYNPQNCIECGCCSYVCVSQRQILQHVLLAKGAQKC